MKRALLLIALLATPSAVLAGPKMTKEFVGSGGQTRAYYLFIPDRPLGAAPAPLLITLHGSGHNGASLVEYWQGLAEQKGFVVAGPDSTNPQQWKYPEDGPDFLRDVVDAVKAKAAIDPRRVYLFGHSAGAYFGLQISLFEYECFAATAIHAGALDPSTYTVFDFAARKIPIFLAIGTDDALVPIASVRTTHAEFQKRGFPVQLLELRRHTHDYYHSARAINEPAWEFLSKGALDKDPKYVEYAK